MVSIVRPADTSPQAFAYLMDCYRKLGPSGRSRIAADLSDAVRQSALSSLRMRHPEYSDAEVSRKFLSVVYRIELP